MMPSVKENKTKQMISRKQKQPWTMKLWKQLRKDVDTHSVTLKHVYLSGEIPEVHDEVGSILHDAPLLKSLQMIETGLIAESGWSIALSLRSHENLTILNLSMNQIGNPGAEHIAQTLRKKSPLKHLNLSQNGITCVGVKSLAAALLKNDSLQCLQLGYNQVKDSGMLHLAETIATQKSLKILDCSGILISQVVDEKLKDSLKLNSVLGCLLLCTEDKDLKNIMVELFLCNFGNHLNVLFDQINNWDKFEAELSFRRVFILNLGKRKAPTIVLQDLFGLETNNLPLSSDDLNVWFYPNSQRIDWTSAASLKEILSSDEFTKEFQYNIVLDTLKNAKLSQDIFRSWLNPNESISKDYFATLRGLMKKKFTKRASTFVYSKDMIIDLKKIPGRKDSFNTELSKLSPSSGSKISTRFSWNSHSPSLAFDDEEERNIRPKKTCCTKHSILETLPKSNTVQDLKSGDVGFHGEGLIFNDKSFHDQFLQEKKTLLQFSFIKESDLPALRRCENDLFIVHGSNEVPVGIKILLQHSSVFLKDSEKIDLRELRKSVDPIKLSLLALRGYKILSSSKAVLIKDIIPSSGFMRYSLPETLSKFDRVGVLNVVQENLGIMMNESWFLTKARALQDPIHFESLLSSKAGQISPKIRNKLLEDIGTMRTNGTVSLNLISLLVDDSTLSEKELFIASLKERRLISGDHSQTIYGNNFFIIPSQKLRLGQGALKHNQHVYRFAFQFENDLPRGFFDKLVTIILQLFDAKLEICVSQHQRCQRGTKRISQKKKLELTVYEFLNENQVAFHFPEASLLFTRDGRNIFFEADEKKHLADIFLLVASCVEETSQSCLFTLKPVMRFLNRETGKEFAVTELLEGQEPAFPFDSGKLKAFLLSDLYPDVKGLKSSCKKLDFLLEMMLL